MVSNYNEALHINDIISTERLILRQFKGSDAPDILEYGSDPKSLEYLVWDGVHTLDAAKAAIYDYYLSKPGIFAIELKAEQKCIGTIDLRLEPEHDKAGFGYVLNRKYWGNGYMTEALSAILTLCFEKLELNRIEANHYVGNDSSGRVMEKARMTRECVAKQQVRVKGVFHDVVHYGIIREEWYSR
ncbi:MAG: GNAT family N-acetyltransferase [Defluviitaleaceae bacterium]|nr:GNAT family N-acetyltransferase [Defluviitaleaceae bacterium]